MKKYVFIIALIVGIGIGKYGDDALSLLRQDSINNSECVYVNKSRCGQTILPKKEFVKVKNDIIEFISSEKAKGNISSASYYFRDLDNGPISYYNEHEKFWPSSLMKLPIMMVYLKKAEKDKSLLEKEIQIDKKVSDFHQNIDSEKTIAKNTSYKIDDLIRKMIIYSNNGSTYLLVDHLEKTDSEAISDLFLELGMADPERQKDDFVNVKRYAELYRYLYEASYLNPEMSEKALNILS